jgi:hypothetical protein
MVHAKRGGVYKLICTSWKVLALIKPCYIAVLSKWKAIMLWSLPRKFDLHVNPLQVRSRISSRP